MTMKTLLPVLLVAFLVGCAHRSATYMDSVPDPGPSVQMPTYTPAPLVFHPMPTLQQQPTPASVSQKAIWTGKMAAGQSVTGMQGFNCEYQYAGRSFWRMYAGSCPSQVDVQ